MKVKLSSVGMRAMLNSPGVQTAVDNAAQAVADNVPPIQAHDREVDVITDAFVTDRPVAGVTLAHAGGIGLEAKYGYLSKAAASAGLQVRAR